VCGIRGAGVRIRWGRVFFLYAVRTKRVDKSSSVVGSFHPLELEDRVGHFGKNSAKQIFASLLIFVLKLDDNLLGVEMDTEGGFKIRHIENAIDRGCSRLQTRGDSTPFV